MCRKGEAWHASTLYIAGTRYELVGSEYLFVWPERGQTEVKLTSYSVPSMVLALIVCQRRILHLSSTSIFCIKPSRKVNGTISISCVEETTSSCSPYISIRQSHHFCVSVRANSQLENSHLEKIASGYHPRLQH
jgi:hypothetical protein